MMVILLVVCGSNSPQQQHQSAKSVENAQAKTKLYHFLLTREVG